jgi:hypothetical protein
VGASGKSTTQTQRHPAPLVSISRCLAEARTDADLSRHLDQRRGMDVNLGGVTPRLKGGAATSPHLERKDRESRTDRYVAMRKAHTPPAALGGFKGLLTTQLPQVVARPRRTCVSFESRLPASTRSGNCRGSRAACIGANSTPFAPVACARAICLTDFPCCNHQHSTTWRDRIWQNL